MTEIERKALALVNECAARLGITALYETYPHELANALCRAIEQHEAFRQEVSDVCMEVRLHDGLHKLDRFIITKPDPLVDVAEEMRETYCATTLEWSKSLTQALAKRGLQITARTEGEPSCEQDAPGEATSSDFGVDAATVLYASLINPEVPLANPIDALRTALAAAEKRGIERGKSEINCHYRDGMQKARDWCIVHGLFDYESQLDAKFCRDLLGSN